MAQLELNGRYGRLTVLEKINFTHHKFKCDCGKIVTKRSQSVKRGLTRSCGCLMKDACRVDLSGKVYGQLTVIEHVEGDTWRCSCECGGELVVNKRRLFQKRATNCGCQKTELMTKAILYGGDNRKTGRIKYDWHVMIDGVRLSLRSSYETIYAQYLLREGIKFQYEPQRFKLEGGDYVPDFYLPERDLWVELKGIMTDESQSRIDRFREATGLKLVVIGEEEINHYLPDGMNYNKFLRAWKKNLQSEGDPTLQEQRRKEKSHYKPKEITPTMQRIITKSLPFSMEEMESIVAFTQQSKMSPK